MGEGVHLTLIRHGESEWNRERRLTGWTDVGLTEFGRNQARWLRRLLDGRTFAGAWSSDLQRASETAELAFGPCTLDQRIREVRFGDLEGVIWTTLTEEQRAGVRDIDWKPEGGESWSDLRDRVVPFIDGLTEGAHIVFTHGGVVRVLLAEVGEPAFVPNASVTRINWSERALVDIVPNGYTDPAP